MTDATAAGAQVAVDSGNGKVKVVGIITAVIGVIMLIAGVFTWTTAQSQLDAQKITVADDAGAFAGEPVDGPFTAYSQATVINKHTLEITGGKTYAELARDDPARETAMTSAFLQASLFTSVIAFGVAALVGGLGIVMILIGLGFIWSAAPRRA